MMMMGRTVVIFAGEREEMTTASRFIKTRVEAVQFNPLQNREDDSREIESDDGQHFQGQIDKS